MWVEEPLITLSIPDQHIIQTFSAKVHAYQIAVAGQLLAGHTAALAQQLNNLSSKPRIPAHSSGPTRVLELIGLKALNCRASASESRDVISPCARRRSFISGYFSWCLHPASGKRVA